MNKEPTQEQAKKLKAEFRQAWPKLNEGDLALYKSSDNREKFVDAVVKRQGVNSTEALKRLKDIEKKCGYGEAKAA